MKKTIKETRELINKFIESYNSEDGGPPRGIVNGFTGEKIISVEERKSGENLSIKLLFNNKYIMINTTPNAIQHDGESLIFTIK